MWDKDFGGDRGGLSPATYRVLFAMRILVYVYSDPLLDPPPDRSLWGSEIDQLYADLGDRSQWTQMLADCEIDPPSYILLESLAHLGETIPELLERLTSLENLGTEILALEDAYRTSTQQSDSFGQARTTWSETLDAIAKKQRQRQLSRGHARNRLKVLPPPGKAPYGYRRGQDRYLIDKTTAPIVKDFCERFVLYGSLRGAVRYLAQRYGKKISVSTGRRWLTSPVYRGNLTYKNGEIIPATHPFIINRDMAAQVDRLLRRNRKLPPRTASASRSLAGLVVCTQCQSTFRVSRVTSRRQPQQYLYLCPSQCPHKPRCSAIAYDQVLNGTIERICQDLPQAVAGRSGPPLDRIGSQIATKIARNQALIQQVTELETEGVLDTHTADLRRYTLRTEIGHWQTQQDQLPPVNLKTLTSALTLPEFWLDLSEAERRFYFREFITCIELHRQTKNCKTWDIQLRFVF
ncbi:MAG: recombinase family protein [Cyanobacteria bacterium P01_H01_bin.15]